MEDVENNLVSVSQQSFERSILKHFTQLVREEMLTLDKSVVHNMLRFILLHYGYRIGGFVRTSSGCGTVDGNPIIMERSTRTGVRHRVFVIRWERDN